MRLLISLHRYLGIAVGWLIVLWCLSGSVMIYVPYPAITEAEYVEALPLLDLRDCCTLGNAAWLAETPAADFSIETFGGLPVLALAGRFGDSARVSLLDGNPVEAADAAAMLRDVEARTAHWPDRGPVVLLGEVTLDQWTVGYYRPGQTLYRIALGDAAGTQWYLSTADGSVVQQTTARERFWNYPGSVLHWLYFTPLRSQGQPWADTVIWSSLVALILTVLGIVLGLVKARFGSGRGLSPYRGLARWHHVVGLCFGLLASTWLLSGLLSMNPWGLLAGSGPRGEAGRLEGEPPALEALGQAMTGWSEAALPAGTTYLEAAPLDGAPYLIAHTRNGERHRLDAMTLEPAALDGAALAAAAARLRPDASVVEAGLMHTPDAYYYDHKTRGTWPVYRVILDDPERTRYYLDPLTGQILDRIDGTRSAYRWLFTALHSLDFAAILRIRPLWDLLMLAMLAGVIVVSATGSWLGIRFLARRSART